MQWDIDSQGNRILKGGDRISGKNTAGKKALHPVSAWAADHLLVLEQVAVEEKSHEITALPLLLRQHALAGCIVTLDAMGSLRPSCTCYQGVLAKTRPPSFSTPFSCQVM